MEIYDGERFEPNFCDLEMKIEHMQRYNFAKDFVTDKIVLDAACGEGYGSAILAESAKQVYGLDLSEHAIKRAEKKYGKSNLLYRQGNVCELPFESNYFDIIISFETIEHIDEAAQLLFIQEIKRVLKDDGKLIISTPNKKYYTDVVNAKNEFHIKEFYKEEFEELLLSQFENSIWYSQYPSVAYFLQKDNTEGKLNINKQVENSRYFIAIAYNGNEESTNEFLSVEYSSNIFYEYMRNLHDLENKVLQVKKEANEFEIHLISDIKKLNHDLIERHKIVEELNEELSKSQAIVEELNEELSKSQAIVEELNEELSKSQAIVEKLNEELKIEKEKQKMKIDLVFVTYNSEKWIKQCFYAIKNVDYNLKHLSIYVYDNASKDNTITLLKEMKEKMGEYFNEFKLIEGAENLGFGRANNVASKLGNSDIICFLNIDTEIYKDAFIKLEKAIAIANKDVAVWEFKQYPYEHPKLYDPITLETSWCSGAAFAARRTAFEKVNGFDERLFMYAEDVDLSWKLRAEGYKINYCPNAKIIHYSYASSDEIKPNQHVFGVINNLLLRFRYGSLKTIIDGQKLFFGLLVSPPAFSGSKQMLIKEYFKNMKHVFYFRKDKKYRNRNVFTPMFDGWNFATVRDGAYHKNIIDNNDEKVSIIVRTCGRPSVLRETLISLRNQTYENFEIVIVEDGENISESMIKNEFSDLNINYFATETKVGRSKAGNLAMERATGKYLNFLDDDDLFFADHIEVLANSFMGSNNKASYSTGFETPIVIHSKEPYQYTIKDYRGVHKQPFDKLMLCHHNYIPIQCIMFEKELFSEFGGLDETVDALEDWDMWLRYALQTNFNFIFKTTSIYRVPFEHEINQKRQKDLDDALIFMREKHKEYEIKLSPYDVLHLVR